jgi:hypothetical protein
MAEFLLPTLAVAALALLAAAGVAHTRHPAALREALDRQDLLPADLRTVVGRALGPIELGVAVVAAVVSEAGFAVAVLGAAFAVHLVVLLRLRPDAPCGCEAGRAAGSAVSPFDLGRALLVLAGGVALVVLPHGLTAAEALTALVAGVTLALAVDVVARSQRTTDLLGSHP